MGAESNLTGGRGANIRYATVCLARNFDSV